MKSRVIVAGAFVILAATWLGSQIVLTGAGSTVVSPPALRQGTFISPDVVVPTNITTITFAFDNMPTADFENPLNSIAFVVECSPDGVTGFIQAAGFKWVGTNGPFVDSKTGVVDPPSTVTFDARRWIGQHCRANVAIPNPLTAGLTVSTQ